MHYVGPMFVSFLSNIMSNTYSVWKFIGDLIFSKTLHVMDNESFVIQHENVFIVVSVIM